MKKLIPILSLGLVLGGCQTFSDVCMAEARAHTKYMLFVAPFRAPERVAVAIQYHTTVQAACATGKPLAIIRALAGQAEAARK